MSNVIQLFPPGTARVTVVKAEVKDLDWFLQNVYYGSDYESDFTREAMENEWMDEYGSFTCVEGHLAQVNDWLQCLSDTDLEDDVYEALRIEMWEVDKWWATEGAKTYG